VGGVGARQHGVGPQPAAGIEAGPHQIQPAARGIRPQTLRDHAVLRDQVDHLRVAKVDGALQRRDAVRPGAEVGAGVEQQAHVLHPVEADSVIQRDVQAGGLADQQIDGGARRTEGLAGLGPEDLPPGEHRQQDVGLARGQLGQPGGVAGQHGFGLRAHAPPVLLAFGLIALGFLGGRHELPPGREADLPGDDQPRVAKLSGGGVGGRGVPGHLGAQPGQRARVAAAQLGEQGIGLRGIAARSAPQPGNRPVAGGALALDVRPELGPGPESVFLGQDELGVAEQEPLGGPVAQHLGRPGLGGRIPRFVRALQVLGLLAVVLQVGMSRQLGMTIRHHNLLRRRGPLARPERGWSCSVRLTVLLEVGKSLPADRQRPRTLHPC
jgi:hypothetical protein